jgi:SWI/SNF-related matrix-associated actin-dependent regulator 1 of chromatin subfamily A
MTAASEGLTLTAASDVVFCELGWTPAIHEQCVSRAYGRVNDMHGATAWYILAPNTIDEDMYELLDTKRRIVDAVTDGVEDDGKNGSVMSELMIKLAERGMRK